MKAEYDFSKAKRGAVIPTPRGKTRIMLVLDDKVLDWFRRQVHVTNGGDYLALINDALKEYVREQEEPLEQVLRRVVREELSASYKTKSRRARIKPSV